MKKSQYWPKIREIKASKPSPTRGRIDEMTMATAYLQEMLSSPVASVVAVESVVATVGVMS
jgi:hypothetical protein